jgi:hypothetical protein
MKHDKRGWHVIGRGDDRRVYGGPFDSEEAALSWCRELGRREHRPISVHMPPDYKPRWREDA